MSTVSVSAKLPSALAKWLRKRSKDLGRTQSDLIRHALETQKIGCQNSGRKSCGELLAELGGMFEGPADLSTNPKYLEDYGK